MYIRTEFRLKTALQLVGIAEPTIVTPDIKEPVKWSDVPLIGEVDDQYHGFNYQYSEGSIKLDFTCESALELLLFQYQTFGTDADVEFHIVDSKRDGTERVAIFAVQFTTVEITAGRVSASVTQKSIGQQVKSRFDSPVDISSMYTLDNQPIAPPSVHQLPLPGQTLHEVGQLLRQGRFSESKSYPNPGLGNVYYLLPNMVLTTAELTTTPGTTINAIPSLEQLSGISTLSGGFAAIDPFTFPLITADTPGTYHIEIDWLYRQNISLTKQALTIGKAQFGILNTQPVVIIRQAGKADKSVNMCPFQSGNGYVNSVEHLFDGTFRADLELAINDQVFIHSKIIAFAGKPVKQIDFYIETYNLRILVDRKTRAKATRTNAYSLPEALRHTIGVITSAIDDNTGTGRVYGSLIDQASNTQAFDGPATEYDLATGLQLRGMPKPPSYTAKTLLETLSALHNVGILYERDLTTQLETMRVEPGEWFYRGGEILQIDEVFEYKEDPDNDLLYNQIIVGYEKFPDSGPGVADEFNTIRTYQTPLVKTERKLEIKCPLIGAGTAIEEARRLGIKKTDANGAEVPTTSDAGGYDDDGFIIHVIKQGYTDTLKFIIEPPAPFPGKPYEAHYIEFRGGIISQLAGGLVLKIGDRITISGSGTANDGKTFDIIGIKSGSITNIFYPTYEVFVGQPMVATGEVTATWQAQSQPGKIRTNERLDVYGVTDPQTVYNLELTPARMLRRHAPFINSGLAFKKPIDELRCTAYKGNGRLTTQIKPGSPPLPGDTTKQLIRDVGNISLGDFEGFEKLFYPELIYCKVRLTREQVELLFDQMQGRGPEESQLGYVSVLNPDGNYVSCYLRKITYVRNSEVADLVLRKRRPATSIGGPSCEDYKTWSFGRFEVDQTADPNLYRFCRFSDFN